MVHRTICITLRIYAYHFNYFMTSTELTYEKACLSITCKKLFVVDERKRLLCVNIDFSLNNRLKRNKQYDFYRGSTVVTAEKGVIWSRHNDTVDLHKGDVVVYAAIAISIRGHVLETDEHFANISMANGIPIIINKGVFEDKSELTEV